jgi:uncharacterized membrane protein (UPF0127 family)
MQIHNTTRNTVVTDEAKIASNLLDKSLGLLDKRNPRSLLFNTRFGVHTVGLRLPIDLIILDKKNRVVELKENCLPNNFIFWNPIYGKVLELPLGTIRKSKTKKGDILIFTE